MEHEGGERQMEKKKRGRGEEDMRKINPLFTNMSFFFPPLINIGSVLFSPLDDRLIAFIYAAGKIWKQNYSQIFCLYIWCHYKNIGVSPLNNVHSRCNWVDRRMQKILMHLEVKWGFLTHSFLVHRHSYMLTQNITLWCRLDAYMSNTNWWSSQQTSKRRWKVI